MQFPAMLLPFDLPDDTQLQALLKFSRLADNPDLIWVRPPEDKHSISIDQVHGLQGALNFKPYAESHRAVVIAPAHLLTLPAQQALLKLLEEPPENTQIILASSLPGKLLPTILSRLVNVNQGISKSVEQRFTRQYDSLLDLSVSECLKFSDVWGKERLETIAKVRDLIMEIRDSYLKNTSLKLLKDEEAAISCLTQLEQNVNVKLSLDHLFFRIAQKIK